MKEPLNPSRNLLCTICATLLLSACSYFDVGEEEVNLDTPSSDAVELAAPAGTASDIDVVGLINSSGDPSVQVFSLDGASPAPGSGSVMPAVVRGPAASQGDSSVQVYPLDGAPSAGYAPAAAPAPVSSAVVPGSPEAKIYFDHDSDSINSEASGVVSGLVTKHKNGGSSLSVEGHASVKANFADEVQRKIVNLRVSMNRALAVARALISGGVPAENIRTVAWGDSHPPLVTDGRDAEAAARRVEVFAQAPQ